MSMCVGALLGGNLLSGRRSLKSLVLVMTILFPLSCSSCSNVSPASHLKPPAIGTPEPPSAWWAAQSNLPLMAYSFSDQDQALVFNAIKKLKVQCMHRSGYPNYDGSDTTYQVETPATRANESGPGVYGYIDAAQAHKFAFNVPGVQPGPGSVASIPTAEEDLANKCGNEAEGKVPFEPADQRLADQLFNESHTATVNDGRYRDALARWSACMKRAGYAADDPVKFARDSMSRSVTPATPEFAAAAADVACTRESDLAGVYFALEAGYQRELIASNAKPLEQVIKQNQAEVVVAKGVAADGTHTP